MKYQLLYSKGFKKQYRRLYRSSNKSVLLELDRVINKLEKGDVLSQRNRNHVLVGNLKGFFECHVLPDCLLIYYLDKDNLILELIAIGSHSELFK